MPRRLLIFPLAAALVGSSSVAASALIPLDDGGPRPPVVNKPAKVQKSQRRKANPTTNPVWDAVAVCESSGNWDDNTGNGFYGGLQFTEETWIAEGGSSFAPYPQEASRIEQIEVAERTLADQGPNAWPVCGPRAGLTSAD